MIEPVLSGEDFLRDVLDARNENDAFHLWWLGQSGYLVQWRGHHLLLDPYLSDSLTRKYAGTNKPHTRMTSLVIAPERLDFIDVVTSSHNHTDHLDAETLNPLRKVNPGLRLIIPEANRAFVTDRLGCDPAWPLGLDDGETLTVDEFTFTGIAAAHENVDRDEQGRCRYLGYVVRFGPWTFYHAGDTVRYEGMVERLKDHRIGVALLPINGRDPARGVPGNLDGPEAAALAKAIGARRVIPCHYEMFEFNTVTPDAFIAEAERLNQPWQVLRCGERWSNTALS